MAFRCLFQRRYDFSVEGYVVTDENELNYEILVERVDYLAGELQGLAEDVHLYHEIFEDAEAVEMLNKTAPRLFLRFQRATKDAVFSAISRITDAAEFGEGEEQRKNISVKRIRKDIQELQLGSSRDRKRLSKAVDKLCKIAKPIRNLRNRKIGHLDDENTRLGTLLTPDCGYQIDEFLGQSQKVIDVVVTCLRSGQDGSEQHSGYTVRHSTYQKHSDAFLFCMKYLLEKHDDWTTDLARRNLDQALTSVMRAE